jgi:hypothetical protein
VTSIEERELVVAPGDLGNRGSAASSLRERVSSWSPATASLVAVAFIMGAVIAVRSTHTVLYDDAAITFRYAERIASGRGFTYNNGDRTNGASAPLYTLILAALHWLGIDLEFAAKAIGVLVYASTCALVAYIARRIGGLVAGVVALVFIATCLDFQIQALSGMESAFAAALGLLAIACLLDEHDTAAGVFVGLALWNKLDAGLLALAIALVFLAILRRPPWRAGIIALAVVLPWFLFAQLYFGSIVPYSASQKLSVIHHTPLNHAWIWDSFRSQHFVPVVVLGAAAAIAVPFLMHKRPRAALALGVCVLWPLFHAIAFSFLDLGDPYPWYKAVLYPPIAIAAGSVLGLAAQALWTRRKLVAVVGLATVVAVAFGVLYVQREEIRSAARNVRHGYHFDDYQSFEATRKEAGIYLARTAKKGDVILTCFGWVAYEAKDQSIKETCPLSTRKAVGPPRWFVDVSFPGILAPPAPAGSVLVKQFVSTAGPGGASFVYRFIDRSAK